MRADREREILDLAIRVEIEPVSMGGTGRACGAKKFAMLETMRQIRRDKRLLHTEIIAAVQLADGEADPEREQLVLALEP
jgi:hypothetical protein